MSTILKNKIIRNKGKNLLLFPKSFVVVDIETTGFDPKKDEILEIGAIKVKDGVVVDTFSTLIEPCNEVGYYITQLTGIRSDMLLNAPKIDNVITRFYSFIEDNIILGHNVNFDINFLYDKLLDNTGIHLTNDFVDTMKLGRCLLKDLKRHRLVDIASYYGISTKGSHRALNDCEITLQVYNNIYKEVLIKYTDVENFIKSN